MNMSKYGQIDLHLHLDGSLPAETILRLAKEEGIQLPAETIDGLKPYICAGMNCKSLNEYLKCFDIPLKVLQTERGLCQAARELGGNLKEKGLRYAEVRFAPQLHCQKGMSQEQAVKAVLLGLAEAQEDAREDIGLRTILCCMRGQENKEANLQTVRLASKYLDKGVVAVDLAGAEALFPTADYEEEFALARELNVPFTIHAGEAAGPLSIRKAVEFGAARIGHGVRAIEDEELMELLAIKQIPLEMCPISNLQTKAVRNIADYPLRAYLKKGIKVTINSDNMTVSDTWAGKEFQYLAESYGLTEEEAKQLLSNACYAAFGDLHDD